MGTLDGRAALVTGSAQGIGRGIAHALAKEGASEISIGCTITADGGGSFFS